MSVDVRFFFFFNSESLAEYAEEKVDKLMPHCRGEVNAHFDISIQGRKKSIELTFKTKLNTYHASASSDDYYLSVDIVVNKVLRQVKKHRQKLKMHKKYAVAPTQEDYEAA